MEKRQARLRRKIDEVEERFASRPERDITKEPGYIMMRKIIEKSNRYANLFR